MTIYNIQSPDGRIIKVEGDTRPTEAELDEIFQARGSINQNALNNVKSSADIPEAGQMYYERQLSKWEQAKQYAENRPQWQKGMSWIEYSNMVKKYDAKFGIEPSELNPLKLMWKNSVTNSPLVEITSKPFRKQKEERASKYVDNSKVITEIPTEAKADWLKKGEIKAGEAFQRSDWSRAVPFVGSLNTFTELFDIKSILDKYNKGEELNAIEIKKLNTYILDVAEQNYRGISFGGKFVQGALELPSFMGEFVATDGLASIGKEAMKRTVTKGLQNATQKEIGKRLTKGLIESGAGAITRTSLGMPMRVAENYGNRRIADGLQITDKGQVALETMSEAPAMTFLKAWGDAVIENWSEEMGDGITEGLGIAAKTLIPRGGRSRFLKAVAKYKPDIKMPDIMTKAGYNGIIGELGEERAGDVIRAVFNINDMHKDDGTPMNSFERILDALTPDKEQWLLELGLFSIPGAVSFAGNRVAAHLRNKGMSEYDIQDYMHYSSELEKEKLLADISDKKVSEILNNLDEKDLQIKSDIETDVINLAKNAGVQDEQASAAAQILSNRAMAVSKLYDIDAKDWYNNLNLDIKGNDTPLLKGGVEYNQIAPPVDTPEFKKWFGDSKVVDEQGKPLVVYHGSANSFSIFKQTKSVRTGFMGAKREVKSPVFFFTPSKQQASDFAKDRANSRINYEVKNLYLSLKNPIDLTKSNAVSLAKKMKLKDRFGEIPNKNNLWELFDEQKNIDILKENGYDGAIISEKNAAKSFNNNDKQSATTYVAFNPEQIKSVDNKGTFDPDNPNIYYQSAMRRSRFDDFTKFYQDVLSKPKNTKNKEQFNALTKNGLNLRIPHDTILHEQKKHKLTAEQWQDLLNNIDDVSASAISSQKPRFNGKPILLKINTQKDTFGVVLETFEKNNPIVATAFIDSEKNIDNWLSNEGIKNEAISSGTKTTFLSNRLKDIITNIQPNFKPFNVDIYYQTAFHGSPYKFDKFSLDHIGKGEGAQTYGWGLYFAGKRDVSEYYRNVLSQLQIYYDNKPVDTSHKESIYSYIKNYGKERALSNAQKLLKLENNINSLEDKYKQLSVQVEKTDITDSQFDKIYDEFIKTEKDLLYAESVKNDFLANTIFPKIYYFTTSELIDFIKNVDESKIEFKQGQLYKVDIPEDDVLLDWDKSINEQSKAFSIALFHINREVKNLNDERRGLSHKYYGKENGKRFYIALRNALGSDKEASLMLNKYGIKGIKYLDGNSRTDGEGSHNYVIFDDNAINVLETYYQEQAHSMPKGAIKFSTNETVIKLFESADESTLLHELGHLFLQDLINTASFNEKALEDLTLVNDWLGYNGHEYTKEQHEKFARGFESYVMSGKAPTSLLENVFSNFKEWLKNIYISVNHLGVEMSDEAYKVYDRLFASERNTTDIDKINDIVNKAIEHSHKQNGTLTEYQKRYKETAYNILAYGIGRSKNWLKANIEGAHTNKRKSKNISKIQWAINNIDDPYSGGDGMLPEWREFFSDPGVNHDNMEVNADIELAQAAFDVLMSRKYYKSVNNFEMLDEYEKQYQFILDLYRKTKGEARDYPSAAMCYWFEKIDEEFRPLFEERFDADVKDIDRFEHLDKYEKAKERILRNMKKLKSFDKNKEFENVIRASLASVNFLTAKDKQRLFYNFLELKTVDDLKNNIDEIMDISKCMEDMNYRKMLDEKIQKELKYTKNIKSGNHQVGRFDYKTNKIFEEIRNLNKLTQEQAQTVLAEIEFDEEKTLTFEEKLRNKFLTYKANGNIYLSSDLIHSLYEDIISLKIAGRFAKKDMALEKQLNRQANIDELLSVLQKKDKANILAKNYVPFLANWESALNLIFNGNIKDKYSLLNNEADVQNYAFKHKQEFQKSALECYNLNADENLENLGISNFELDNKILENLAEEYEFSEKVEGENFPITLNKMQIINIYIANKNELSNARLVNQFGIIQLNSILSKLDKCDKELGDLLQRTAGKFYNEINKIFIQKYGIELPKVKNYFPSVAEHISEIDLFNDYVERSMTPSFIKSRINNDNVTLKFGNPIQTLYSHIDKTSRFILMTERLDAYNQIFKNKKVARKISEIYGQDTYKSLLQILANSSYTKKGAVYDGWNGLFNKLLNNWVVTKIAVKPTIMIKQLLSVFNYAADMPVSVWGKGFVNAVSHPKKTIAFMMKDEYLKTRFQSGSQSEYLKETIKSLEFAKTKKLADFFTLSVRLGDVGAIAFGGKPYVDYLMKEKGMSEKEAFQEFRLATMRSQQASVSSSLSNFQNDNTNPLARTFFAFRNTSNQYMRKVADSIITYSNGEMSKTQLAKNLFIYTFLNSFLYKTATSLSVLRLIMTGDDDDLISDFVSSIFDLNAVALPLIGDAYQYALSKLVGESKPHSSIPALDEIYTSIDKLKKEDFSFGDFLYIVNNLIEIGTGVPTNALTNTIGGISDIAHGGFIGGTLRILGYSDRRSGLTTGSIKIKKSKKRKRRKKRKIKRYI